MPDPITGEYLYTEYRKVEGARDARARFKSWSFLDADTQIAWEGLAKIIERRMDEAVAAMARRRSGPFNLPGNLGGSE